MNISLVFCKFKLDFVKSRYLQSLNLEVTYLDLLKRCSLADLFKNGHCILKKEKVGCFTLNVLLMPVMWLFLLVPWVSLQYVIVVLPDHTHLLF